MIVLVAVFLLYPALRTFVESFMKQSQRRGEGATFVGFDNYVSLFTDPNFISVLINNALWVLVVPAATVLVRFSSRSSRTDWASAVSSPSRR